MQSDGFQEEKGVLECFKIRLLLYWNKCYFFPLKWVLFLSFRETYKKVNAYFWFLKVQITPKYTFKISLFQNTPFFTAWRSIKYSVQTCHVLSDGGYRLQPTVLPGQYGTPEPHSSPSFLIRGFSSLVLRTNSIRWSLENVLGGQKIWKTLRVNSWGISVSALCLQDFMASDPKYTHGKGYFLWKMKNAVSSKTLALWRGLLSCSLPRGPGTAASVLNSTTPQQSACPSRALMANQDSTNRAHPVLAPDQELIPPWKCTMTKCPAFQKGLTHSAGLGHMDIIKAALGGS